MPLSLKIYIQKQWTHLLEEIRYGKCKTLEKSLINSPKSNSC